MSDLNITIYTVMVEFEYEHTIRDEFGWVEGHGPGCGDYRKKTETKRIQASREVYVRAWVEYYYSKQKNVVINSITPETVRIDAIIKVTQ